MKKTVLSLILTIVLLLGLSACEEPDTPAGSTYGDVADLFIVTETGLPITDKTYQNATIRIEGAKDNSHNVSLATEIRGRGNSSFNGAAAQDTYDSKNSYRLKLREATKLLGVGKDADKDWVLNANKFDLSNLRNAFAWELAREMGTLPYVPGCTWVNLYINGDYRGLYMLSEHVETSSGRVNVEDSLTEPDKGYLIELDFRGDTEEGAEEGLTYFRVPGFHEASTEFVIKSEVTSREETAFIRDYVIACHEAIMSGDYEAIESLVDIPSLVDMFLLEELSKEMDAGSASLFMQKDTGGKLTFTAPWDFDFGFGVYGPAVSTGGFTCEDKNYTPNVWFKALLEQTWFLQAVSERLVEIEPMVENARAYLQTTGESLGTAADLNDEKWNTWGEKVHPYISNKASKELDSYKEHLEYLDSWITERFDWLEKEVAERLK